MFQVELAGKYCKTINSEESQRGIDESTLVVGCDEVLTIYRSFIYFDLSPIPEGTVITSASLRLYLKEATTVQTTINVVGLREAFDEGTTYSNQPLVDDEFFAFNIYPRNPGTIDLDITRLATKWKSGSLKNNGFMLRTNEVIVDKMLFGSTRGSEYTFIPRLIIQYSTAEGSSGRVFREQSFEISFSGTYASTVIEVSHLIQGTFFMENLLPGTEVEVIIEVSPDNNLWLKSTGGRLSSRQAIMLVPKYFGKYYRIKCSSPGYAELKASFSYQVFI